MRALFVIPWSSWLGPPWPRPHPQGRLQRPRQPPQGRPLPHLPRRPLPPPGKPSGKPSGKPLTVNVSPPRSPLPRSPLPRLSGARPQGVNHLLVSTGDTVQANGQTLKLYGIFAPSFQRRCEHHSAMRSRNGLLALVSHHRITMQRREGNQTRIKLLAGGHDVANLMVAHGLAVRGKQRPRFC
jgi:endonuclease YncB( thermonuclease family)